jgi:hypothetical protein
MLQHVLLLTVAPPLILLGRPGATSWRAFPLGVRRASARALAHSPRWAPLRAFVRLLTAPNVALALFVVTMAVWHVPALYDGTLRSPAIHYLEHVLFLVTGLLLWSRLVDSPPLWSRLSFPVRACYASAAMVACWVLALVLGLAPSPLYTGYTELVARPGGISALADPPHGWDHVGAGLGSLRPGRRVVRLPLAGRRRPAAERPGSGGGTVSAELAAMLGSAILSWVLPLAALVIAVTVVFVALRRRGERK